MIESERWVLVQPATDRTLQWLCVSWSRKWIVISFYGHEKGCCGDSDLVYNWDTRVYSLSGQTLMVSALRRMIEESHTLTVEATVNQKKWLFGQFVDCTGFTLCSAIGLPLSHLRREYSSAELNGCNFKVKGRTLLVVMEGRLWTCCHCPWKYSKWALRASLGCNEALIYISLRLSLYAGCVAKIVNFRYDISWCVRWL